MSERKGVRWWPAVGIAAICLGVLAWIRLGSDLTGQERFVHTVFALFLTLVLLLLWLLLLSRLPWKARLIGLAGVLVLALAVTQLVSIRGVSGDLVPILEWRWAGPGGGEASGMGAVAAVAAARTEYPQFLGPRRDASLPGIHLARDWQAQPPRELWRRPVGEGWSAFAISGGRAVTQEQHGDEERVVAYDLATGEILWSHGDETRYETTIGGVGPRSTPAIVGGRVFVLGAMGRLNALDLETGEKLWSRDIIADTGATVPEWGKSCSPLVVGDLVVVSAGGPAGGSLVAYDRASGEVVWSGGNDRSGYSSPLATTLAGVEQVVIFNQASVAGHHPVTGEVLWQLPWSSDQPNVSQPLPLAGDRLLVSSGYGIGSKMIRLSRDGVGKLEPEVLWESPRLKAKFTNVVAHQGSIYGLDDGTLVCLDPETGERRWKRGRYGHGQLILVGDLLLIQGEKGEVVLVEANPGEHVEVARIAALKGKSWNSPAFAAPYLVVRNDREAVCYELALDS